MRRRGFLFFLLLCAVFPAAAGQPASQPGGAAGQSLSAPQQAAERGFLAARRETNLHHFDAADALIAGALAPDPGKPETWPLHRLRFRLYSDFRQVHRLVPYYQALLASQPRSPIGYCALAMIDLENGAFQNAEARVNLAAALDPRALAVMDLRAQLETERLKSSASKIRAAYESLIRAFPDFSPGYEDYLSWLFPQAARRGLAGLLDWRDRARMKRLLALVRGNRALDPSSLVDEIALRARDPWLDPQVPIRMLREILGRDASLVDVQLRLARAYGNAGDGAAQEAILKSIVQTSPDWVIGWTQLQAFYANHQQYALAMQCLDRAAAAPLNPVPGWRSETQRAEYMIDQNQFDEAQQLLNRIIATHAVPSESGEAKALLSRLLARREGDRMVRLPNVPYLVQRGEYCGPASLSMLLGFWGDRKTQDEIAADIFTGIAGTAAQTIQAYCRQQGFQAVSFQGDVKAWKRLLDQGVPVLWLQYSALTEGHYRVITGYDDLAERFLLHDPNFSTESEIPYRMIDDEWALPNQKQSLAIFPMAKAGAYDLSALRAPLLFRAMNEVIYLATGSNLFRGFFPAILLNLFAAGLPLALLAWLMIRAACPWDGRTLARYVAINWGAVALCGSMIVLFRSQFWVALFVVYHLSLLAMIALLIAWHALFMVFRRYLALAHFERVHAAAFVALFSVHWIDRMSPWALWIPLALMIGGAAWALRDPLAVLLFGGSVRPHRRAATLRLLRRLGSAGVGDRALYEALLGEARLATIMNDDRRALELGSRILALRGLRRPEARRTQRMMAESALRLAEQTREDDETLPARAGAAREAQAQIEALARPAPRGCEGFYRAVLEARALIALNEMPRAGAAIARAEAWLARRGPGQALGAALDFLQGRRAEIEHYRLLHAINRLSLAQWKGGDSERATIQAEYESILDRSYFDRRDYAARLSQSRSQAPGDGPIQDSAIDRPSLRE